MLNSSNIPNGWSAIAFEEMVESTTLGTAVRGVDDTPSINLVKMGNLLWGGLNLGDIETVASGLVDNVDELLLQHGDFLFNTRNTAELVGKSCTWRNDLGRAIFDNNILRVRFLPAFNPFYIASWMNNGAGRRAVRALACGSTSVSAVYWRDLRKLKIPLPPLQQQNAIMGLIGVWEAAVSSYRSLLVAKEKRLSWLRSQVLTGRTKLPGCEVEWVPVRMKDLLTEHGLKSAGGEEVFSVSVHKGLINQIEHLGRSFAAKTTGHYNRVRPGDVVYTKSPTGDFPLGIFKQSDSERDVIVSPLYGVFTPKTRSIGVLLDCLFAEPRNASNYLGPLVQKGAKNTISIANKRFLEGQINFCLDPKEQDRIADVIHAMKSEINLIKRLASALDLQRRGLLQRFLTGSIRAPIFRQTDEVTASPMAVGAAQ